MWIVIIIGILIIFGLFSVANSNKEANETEQFAANAQKRAEKKKQRVAAYADYLRRTQPEIHGNKTHNELNDEISMAVDAYAKGIGDADNVTGIIIFIGFCISIFFGALDKEWSSFFICGGMSLACGYWYDSSAQKQIHKEFLSKGWEPERLKL